MNRRVIYFIAITVILAVFISPFASSAPDGLERVAHDLGFLSYEKEPMYHVFSDYSIPFVANEFIGTGLSGFIGIGLISLFTLLGVRKVRRKTMIKQ